MSRTHQSFAFAALLVLAACQDNLTSPVAPVTRGAQRSEAAGVERTMIIGTGIGLDAGQTDPFNIFYYHGESSPALAVIPPFNPSWEALPGTRTICRTASCLPGDSLTREFDVPADAFEPRLSLLLRIHMGFDVGLKPEVHLNGQLVQVLPSDAAARQLEIALRPGRNRLTIVQQRSGFDGLAALSTVEYMGTITYIAEGPVCTVTTLQDNGAGSLRAKLANPACATINFGVTGTIGLSNDELVVPSGRAVTIVGPGASLLAISGNDRSRVFRNEGKLTIEGVTLRNAYALEGEAYYGGAVRTTGGTLTIRNSVLEKNVAGQGGAIGSFGSTIVIDRTTIRDNQSLEGGGLLLDAGNITITNSTISSNKAEMTGGGVAVHGAAVVTITNTTISGNTSVHATGGLDASGGSELHFAHVTIAANAGMTVGGLNVHSNSLDIAASVVAGNGGIAPNCTIQTGQPVSSSYNVFGNLRNCAFDGSATDHMGVTNEDLKLAPLADNGGPTWTHLPLATSPLIDRVPSHKCTITSDQRAIARPQGPGCDAGAVEAEPIDNTVPLISAMVNGAPVSDGWYRTDATVDWTAEDPESGMMSRSGCDDFTLAQDTGKDGTKYTCSATNNVGLTNEVTITVKRDATVPAIGYSPHPAIYTVDQAVSITCSANDAASGIASNTCADISGQAYDFNIGRNDYGATATDVAGNFASESTRFDVVVTANGLSALVTRWVSHAGTANSLTKKLEHGQTGAFINEVNAQSGKKIPADKAAILIKLARAL